MFKFRSVPEFGFQKDEDDPVGDDPKCDNTPEYECRKVEVDPEISEKVKTFEENVDNFVYEGNLTLTCLSPSKVIDHLKTTAENSSDVLDADKNHSDLIPGKYEGGLKIWECTRDLVNYLQNNKSISLDNVRVLDLGCGAGILGIIALLQGAATVTFQDYNHEVLELATIPNVYLNFKNTEIFKKCKFYSGGWTSFLNIVAQSDDDGNEVVSKKLKTDCHKFDYILSSETIYNPDNYDKIYKIVKELMKDDGTCLIAGKKCYFGVGGNTECFSDYVTKEHVLDVKSCWSSSEGVAREILQVTFRKDQS